MTIRDIPSAPGEQAVWPIPSWSATFEWEVLEDGYRWWRDAKVEGTWDGTDLRSCKQLRGPWLVGAGRRVLPLGAPARRYDPLHAQRNLHRLFARLPASDDEQSLEAVRKFAGRYGRLGVDQYIVSSREPSAVDRQAEMCRTLQIAERFKAWKHEINRMRGMIELLDAYLEPDAEVLRQFICWKGVPTRPVITYRWPGKVKGPVYDRDSERAKRLGVDLAALRALEGNEKLRQPLYFALASAVNVELRKHVGPMIVAGSGVELRPDSWSVRCTSRWQRSSRDRGVARCVRSAVSSSCPPGEATRRRAATPAASV